MKKSIFSMLLAALILASCGETAQTGDTTAADATSAAPETTRDTLDPTLDFGGETVTLIVDKDMYLTDFTAEQTGDIVDDALYKRTLDVQERLNVVLDFFWSEGLWDNRAIYQGHVKNSVLAGDASYDIAAGYSVSIATLAAEGMLSNLADTKHIDISNPWWSESFLEQVSIDGNMYFLTGDISTNAIGTTFAVFFNKELIESYKLENPYKLVDDGKWTLDQLFTMAGSIYSDLNGDSKRDEKDMYGLYSNNTSFDNLYYSAGMSIIEPDKEKGMVVSPDFGSEKMVALLEKLCTAFNHTDGIKWGEEGPKTAALSFLDKHSVFLMCGMSVAANELREATFEYGVVPAPKWDEAQENYRNTHAYTSAFYSIPLDAKNPDMSSAVIEAMAIEGYYNVAPAYFETALKVKYSSDDDSARMFDIIRGSVTYDF
ncbi:MAG: hypothetical protein J6C52_12935, partial [Clostridia bacterium]|nr:hypothetical protein [Clostridia bacterium]